MVNMPKNGEIIYIDFDPSAGAEIQKRKPAVVVSNNQLMATSPCVWVVPISHGKFNGEDYPLHVHLDKRTKMDGTIYTEQLKSFDYINRSDAAAPAAIPILRYSRPCVRAHSRACSRLCSKHCLA